MVTFVMAWHVLRLWVEEPAFKYRR